MTRQIETRLRNEYIWEHYRDNVYWKNATLGQVADQERANIFKVLLRRADAIVLINGNPTIIEFKMFPKLEGLGELIEYKKLFYKTPRFSEYYGKEVGLIFVTTYLDTNLKETMAEHGIKYVIFAPDWAKKYVEERKRVGRV